jgi:hypothetical protein
MMVVDRSGFAGVTSFALISAITPSLFNSLPLIAWACDGVLEASFLVNPSPTQVVGMDFTISPYLLHVP